MFDDFYGLNARPFQLTPDPAYYFESLTHRKALSYLGYGLQQGEGFMVITGEVGAGKSTLVAYLMATIDPSRMSVANVVTSALDGEEIIHVVARAFGLAVAGHDKATALAGIEAHLHEEARAGRRSLLIVDEAQNLSIGALEELRMLSNFQLGNHPLLQTLLLGQPEFRDTLLHSDQLEQLRQRVIASHHLAAMQPDEVRAYVEHRLGCAGWTGNPAFDADVFAGIHAATGGIPRRINQLANRLLLLGSVDRRERIDLAMLDQVIDELEEDGAPSPVSAASATPAVPEPVAARPESAAAALPDRDTLLAMIAPLLAERDARIDALQQALADQAAAARSHDTDLVEALQSQLAEADERVEGLAARVDEQERMLRHVLTMLIEWIEGGDGRREAA